jgi:hypothetical protein
MVESCLCCCALYFSADGKTRVVMLQQRPHCKLLKPALRISWRALKKTHLLEMLLYAGVGLVLEIKEVVWVSVG